MEFAQESGGTTPAFTERVRREFFSSHAGRDERAQLDIAKNVRLSLRAYGLVGEDEQFTTVGRALYDKREVAGDLYAALAKHILLDLHGLDLLRVISHLQQLKIEPTLQAIARELESVGIHVPPSAVHVSTMKLWLQRAGVIDERLVIDDRAVRGLIGYGLEEVDRLDEFGPEMRAFIRALAAINPAQAIPSSRVREHATAMSHVEFDLKNLREQVLYPLRDLGYLEVIKSTSGRGAKAHLVRPTEKFRVDFIGPILDALAKTGGFPRVRLDVPIDQVVRDLRSADRHTKGLALEMLVMHLCRLLGLRVTHWRRRAADTGGAEVDVLADGMNYVFALWQIQCKNTQTVSHDDVARELGIVGHTRANVVMVVTTGRFAKPAAD
ncbi:MAG: restriction endonuclease, partial [Nitrososphaerales archaeon]